MYVLKHIEQLLIKGDLNKAYDKIIQIEIEGNFEKSDRIQVQILKSRILIQMENHKEALLLIEELIKENKIEKKPLLIIDALITKANALFELDNLSECLEVLELVRKKMQKNEIKSNLKITKRDSDINFITGKVHRKKGELDSALEYLQKCISAREKLENEYELADPFNVIGIIYDIKGEHDLAAQYFMKSLELFEKIGNKKSILKLLINIGMNHWQIGKLDEALAFYQRSLTLSKALGDKRYIAFNLQNIGLIHRHKADLSTALEKFEKAFSIFKELGRKREMGTCLNNIGIIFDMRGEPDISLKYFQKGLEIAEKMEDKLEIAFSLSNLGSCYYEKSDYESALISFKKSLELFEEIGNNVYTSIPLFSIVCLSNNIGSTKTAEFYFEKLSKIHDREANKHISQKYLLAKSLLLKISDRVIKRAEAQQILYEIMDDEVIDIEITFIAMLSLCELLLDELRISGSEEVLREITDLLEKLYTIAKDQNSHLWLAKTYWLQSKLALIELDLERAQNLLTQAQTLTEAKGLNSLTDIISNERASLISQLNRWQTLVDKQPTMTEIIELTQFENLLERMVQKKLYRKDEEVLQYAEEARMLAKRWEDYM
jgi:tetratricopeptide (TPR) repeat protein